MTYSKRPSRWPRTAHGALRLARTRFDDWPCPEEPLAFAQYLADHRDLRYRAAVVGESVGDVIRLVGGWMFDQGLAGCHITAVVRDTSGAEALDVFSARCATLSDAQQALEGPWPHVILVASTMYDTDSAVRLAADAIVDRKHTAVYLFPAGHKASGITHRLSSATTAFKSAALHRFADGPGVSPETFSPLNPLAANLLPDSRLVSMSQIPVIPTAPPGSVGDRGEASKPLTFRSSGNQ